MSEAVPPTNPDENSRNLNHDYLRRVSSANFYRQTEIPWTTEQQYITGTYAINIPGEDPMSGGWHDDMFWHPIGVREPLPISLGGQDDFDTNAVYGTMGVEEARERVVGMGLFVSPNIPKVYVANHMRALLDLVYHEIESFGKPTSTIGGVKDWLVTEEERDKLLSEAPKLEVLMNDPQKIEKLHEWIAGERARLEKNKTQE